MAAIAPAASDVEAGVAPLDVLDLATELLDRFVALEASGSLARPLPGKRRGVQAERNPELLDRRRNRQRLQRGKRLLQAHAHGLVGALGPVLGRFAAPVGQRVIGRGDQAFQRDRLPRSEDPGRFDAGRGRGRPQRGSSTKSWYSA